MAFAGQEPSVPQEVAMTPDTRTTGRVLLGYGLWAAQIFVAVMFCAGGLMKLTMAISSISKVWPWTGQVPEPFLRFIGVVDLAGGLGILLPSLIRVQPRLTVLAALGCALLMIFASSFHIYRGEFQALPFNVILLALGLFILWGRYKTLPIPPR